MSVVSDKITALCNCAFRNGSFFLLIFEFEIYSNSGLLEVLQFPVVLKLSPRQNAQAQRGEIFSQQPTLTRP